MRRIITVIAALMLALPASAQTIGNTPLLLFPNKRPLNPDVVYMNPANVPASDKAFSWIPVDGCHISEHYSWNGSGVFHIAHAAPTPSPDPERFVELLLADNAVPTAAYQHVGLLCRLAHNSVRLKQLWAKVSGSLNNSVVTAVESAATAANMPLK